MRFHHLGIACESLTDTLDKVYKMFEIVSIGEMVFDPNQSAELQMLTTVDGLQIELISGQSVAGFVKKRNYLYHTCYEVENIDACLSKIAQAGGSVISAPVEAVLFNGRRVAFAFTAIGIIELLESPNFKDTLL